MRYRAVPNVFARSYPLSVDSPSTEDPLDDRATELARLLGAAREIRDAVEAGALSPDALDLVRELAPQEPAGRAGSGYFADDGPADPLGGTFEVPEHNYGPSTGGRGLGAYGWQDFGEGSGRGSRDPFGVGRWGLVADPGNPPRRDESFDRSLHSNRVAEDIKPLEDLTLSFPHAGPNNRAQPPPRDDAASERYWVPDPPPNPFLPEPPPNPFSENTNDAGPEAPTAAEVALARELMARIASPGLNWRVPSQVGPRVRPAGPDGESGVSARAGLLGGVVSRGSLVDIERRVGRNGQPLTYAELLRRIQGGHGGRPT